MYRLFCDFVVLSEKIGDGGWSSLLSVNLGGVKNKRRKVFSNICVHNTSICFLI